jgi:hypothetical protein
MTHLQTFVRPTNMAVALMNAAVAARQSQLGAAVISQIQKDDKPFTRTEHDGIRVSQQTLNKLYR